MCFFGVLESCWSCLGRSNCPLKLCLLPCSVASGTWEAPASRSFPWMVSCLPSWSTSLLQRPSLDLLLPRRHPLTLKENKRHRTFHTRGQHHFASFGSLEVRISSTRSAKSKAKQTPSSVGLLLNVLQLGWLFKASGKSLLWVFWRVHCRPSFWQCWCRGYGCCGSVKWEGDVACAARTFAFLTQCNKLYKERVLGTLNTCITTLESFHR